MGYGRTIQIFLPDGNPRSLRIAEITSQTLSAILIPRAKLEMAESREELGQCGVYLLLAPAEEDSKPSVYIGEAEDTHVRLRQHNRTKDFWTTAIVIVSKTQHLTKTHVKYLEWLCYDETQRAGRYSANNSNAPTKPYVSEPMKADLHDNFETIKLLVATLGYPIFERIRKSAKQNRLSCTGKDADAQGEYTEDGLVVLVGSKCRFDWVDSTKTYLRTARQKLVDEGILKPVESSWVFQSNHVFSHPSRAAGIVLGREANGWTEWKYGDGRTLHEVHRQMDGPAS